MTNSVLKEFQMTCPQCGRSNELVYSDIPAGMMVECSACHEHLGILGDLPQTAHNDQAHPEHS